MSRQNPRSSVRLLAFVAILFLTACSVGRPATPVAPAPAPVPVPPREELSESPEIIGVEVAAVSRDLLGDAAYDLPVEANTWVEAELDFLTGQRRDVILRWIQAGDYYAGFIQQVLQAHRLPTDLYHLAMIESGFKPTVRSRAGAAGMWQFMPATARSSGLRVDSIVDERLDPVRATHAAARHIRALFREFDDWALAAAAYNAGSGRINRGLKGFGVDNFWDLAERGDLAQETRLYVPRLYAMTVINRGRERFGLPAAATSPAFSYDSVNVEYATPLTVLAEVADLSAESLAALNPHLLRGLTPDSGYWVWVPSGSGVGAQRAYLASDFRKEGGQGVYAVRAGDNLSTLAEIAGVKMSRIRELNPDVDLDPLRIGQKLKLPYRAAQALSARPAQRPVEKLAARTEAPETGRAVEDRAGTGSTSHVVKEGETLWKLARENDLTVEELQRANDLEGSTIWPGQTLRIPGGSAAAAPAPSTEHVVQSGDTLWSIARRYGCSVAALQAANDLGERSTIRPGQTLVVPSVE